MKKYLLSCFLLFAACIGAEAQLNKIDSLLQTPTALSSQTAIMVYDLTADTAIYKHNEQWHIRPASTQKLFTAVAALKNLGEHYLFQTSLYQEGTVSGRTFVGNLYVVGGMDPLFGKADLDEFVSAVQALQIDTLCGYIYADRSMRTPERLGEGWCWDDKNPILSPLLYKRKDQLCESLLSALAAEGLVVICEGSPIGEKACPPSASMLSQRVHRLNEVLMPMMKESDNLYAEAMFYQLGALYQPGFVHARHAKRAVRQLLNEMGVPSSDYRLADGSGLSLYNYTTAEIEVRLLRYAYNHPELYQPLLQSLPIAAVDGTLKERMTNTPAAGNVQAKTGTLSGVHALSGYATASNGHRLCFAIVNQGSLSGKAARALIDAICVSIVE